MENPGLNTPEDDVFPDLSHIDIPPKTKADILKAPISELKHFMSEDWEHICGSAGRQIYDLLHTNTCVEEQRMRGGELDTKTLFLGLPLLTEEDQRDAESTTPSDFLNFEIEDCIELWAGDAVSGLRFYRRIFPTIVSRKCLAEERKWIIMEDYAVASALESELRETWSGEVNFPDHDGRIFQFNGKFLSARPYRRSYVHRVPPRLRVKTTRKSVHKHVLDFIKQKLSDSPDRHTLVVFSIFLHKSDRKHMTMLLEQNLNVFVMEEKALEIPGKMSGWLMVAKSWVVAELAKLIKCPIQHGSLLLLCLFGLPKSLQDTRFPQFPSEESIPKTLAEATQKATILQKVLMPFCAMKPGTFASVNSAENGQQNDELPGKEDREREGSGESGLQAVDRNRDMSGTRGASNVTAQDLHVESAEQLHKDARRQGSVHGVASSEQSQASHSEARPQKRLKVDRHGDPRSEGKMIRTPSYRRDERRTGEARDERDRRDHRDTDVRHARDSGRRLDARDRRITEPRLRERHGRDHNNGRSHATPGRSEHR